MLALCFVVSHSNLSMHVERLARPWLMAHAPPHTPAFSAGHLNSWLEFAFFLSGIEESSSLSAQPPLLSVTLQHQNKFSIFSWHLPGVGTDCHSARTGNLSLCSIGR